MDTSRAGSSEHANRLLLTYVQMGLNGVGATISGSLSLSFVLDVVMLRLLACFRTMKFNHFVSMLNYFIMTPIRIGILSCYEGSWETFSLAENQRVRALGFYDAGKVRFRSNNFAEAVELYSKAIELYFQKAELFESSANANISMLVDEIRVTLWKEKNQGIKPGNCNPETGESGW